MTRTTMRALIAGAALLGGSLLPAASAGSAHAAGSLASFALRKSDVPARYKQTLAKSYSLRESAKDDKVSVATLRAKGWLGTYTSQFARIGKGSQAQISSSIDAFRSVPGAHWDLVNGVLVLRKVLTRFAVFTVKGPGQEALGLHAAETTSTSRYSIVFIVFREGTHVAGVGVTGFGTAPLPTLAQVERYAAIVDGRIKRG